MALIAAGILIPGDYFAINSPLGADALTKLGFAPQRIQELSAMVGVNVTNRPGGAVALAVGMASVFSTLPGMKHLMAYWYNFALMFEALFILTTVDAGTRVGAVPAPGDGRPRLQAAGAARLAAGDAADELPGRRAPGGC